MGCVSGKPDINDIHPNIFEVTNVDDRGHPISPGQLELTDAELILHQRRKSATRWPLRCVRKYGFDADIFSFECGRRCHTGAGIYAFKCTKAEQLFNMLQQNIQLRNISEEANVGGLMYVNQGVVNSIAAPALDCPAPPTAANSAPIVQRRLGPPQPEPYLKPIASVTIKPSVRTLSRPGSLSSDPASPLTPPIHTGDLLETNNNNKQHNGDYTNASVIHEMEQVMAAAYCNVNAAHALHGSTSHLYMNVETGGEGGGATTTNAKEMPNNNNNNEGGVGEGEVSGETQHCYANIGGGGEWESWRASLETVAHAQVVAAPAADTPTYVTVREVNYAELDLVPSTKGETNGGIAQTQDALTKPNKSYVIIDFKKTTALSQSVNPSVGVEEGSRKTRHNSTIGDATRHSNSLSD